MVLSRKYGETVRIGDDVSVTVVAIRGDKVRLGITAPLDTPVNRQEVWEEIQERRENEDGERL